MPLFLVQTETVTSGEFPIKCKFSYKGVISIQFYELHLCLLFLKNNQLKLITMPKKWYILLLFSPAFETLKEFHSPQAELLHVIE